MRRLCAADNDGGMAVIQTIIIKNRNVEKFINLRRRGRKANGKGLTMCRAFAHLLSLFTIVRAGCSVLVQP